MSCSVCHVLGVSNVCTLRSLRERGREGGGKERERGREGGGKERERGREGGGKERERGREEGRRERGEGGREEGRRERGREGGGKERERGRERERERMRSTVLNNAQTSTDPLVRIVLPLRVKFESLPVQNQPFSELY